MSNTPELDAAILHVVNQQRKEGGLEPISELSYIGETRKFVGNIIAELLRGMDEPPLDPPAILGWDLAIKIIKRRAGLEGEG